VIDHLTLLAFGDELEKLAAMSADEKRRKRHEYYIRNRARIKQQASKYRSSHKAQISRKAKIYRRRVKSGAKRKRKRIHSGTAGYQFMGYH